MDMVLAGHPSKNIAADLAISQRAVGNHRASIMDKTARNRFRRLPDWRWQLTGIAAKLRSPDF